MRSILFLVYVFVPLTIGVRNFQNSMIGIFNSGVPKAPNSRQVYELFNNGKKKVRPVVYQKINENIQYSMNGDPQQPNIYLRRDNTANTEEPSKLPLYFPIPGGKVGDHYPYPSLFRLGPKGDRGINIDSLPSSEPFGQYFPVPPLSQGRGGKDILTQGRGAKDVFPPERWENNIPIMHQREYSFPKEKAVREEYNGESNEENNDYNDDMDVYNKIIEELTPPEKPNLSSVKDPEPQDLVDTYKRITNTLNGKVVKQDPLGYIGGSNGVEEVVSVGYNEGRGFNGGSNRFNGGSNGFGGSNGAKKAVRQGYNIQYTGMKARNREYNGGRNGNNGENIKYNQDLLAYTKRIKALPPPEKSWAWTSKSITFSPEEQKLVEKYKRALDVLNGKII